MRLNKTLLNSIEVREMYDGLTVTTCSISIHHVSTLAGDINYIEFSIFARVGSETLVKKQKSKNFDSYMTECLDIIKKILELNT